MYIIYRSDPRAVAAPAWRGALFDYLFLPAEYLTFMRFKQEIALKSLLEWDEKAL